MLSYPVNLLLENRPCLLVGAGRVALRKALRLLECGARVTVIADEVLPAIRELAAGGKLRLLERRAEIADLDGYFLISAATGDRAFNRVIVREARRRRIPVSAVDANWSESDFITPAVLRESGMTVSFSSEGLACRRSKLLAAAVKRQLKLLADARLLCIGVDHRTLPVAERERLFFRHENLPVIGTLLKQVAGMQEFFLLATCNRCELVAVAPAEQPTVELLKLISGLSGAAPETHVDFAAFEHLCLVVAGLYSQTPGEKHITAQFKEALSDARAQGFAGSLLQSLHDAVICGAREIRQTADPLLRPTELEELVTSSFAAALAPGSEILILGTGSLGRAVRQHLAARYRLRSLYHRNRPSEFESFPLSELERHLPTAQAVVSVLSGDAPVLTMRHATLLQPEVKLIDLGVPRNIDPELGATFELQNLDDLKHRYRREECDLAAVREKAREIVSRHRENYEHFKKSFIDGHQGQ